MHISLSQWTAACAVVQSVSAFYPIQPKYGDSDGTSSKGRRTLSQPRQPSLSNTEGATDRSIILPLRRVPNLTAKSISARENRYNILKSNTPKQENSVGIDQDGGDLSYMVAVKFGTSMKEYHLLLDSAASNTWVMGQDCQTEACESHNTFGEGDSSTLEMDSTAFAISYGTGNVSGIIGTDTIHIGSLSTTVTFGLATEVSEEFKDYPMDGILGIGRGDTDPGTIEAPQVMDVLKSTNLIGEKLYGIHLSRAKEGKNDGELNLGKVNKDRFDGDLNWSDTIPNEIGFWEVKLEDAGIGGKLLGFSGLQAIVDTGTSFILMPEEDATSIHEPIKGYTKSGETFTVPCDTTQAIQLKFNNQVYDISAADWIGGQLDNGQCKSRVIGRQTFEAHQWLVGDVFLKNVYSVFDFENNRLGFGVKNEAPTPQQTSSSGSPSPAATGSSTSVKPESPGITPGSSTSNPNSPSGLVGPIPTTLASGAPSPTTEAENQSQGSGSGSGGAALVRRSSASSFALSVAVGLLSMFI